ncbi:MAG: hypothetical protein IPM54_17335 [Polyangiaceae bacterium]|nr:hypothetical protein [Polyangiaceae bacterium]
MGAFNTVRGQAICPKCDKPVEVVGQFKYGNVRQVEYQLGDVLQWGGNQTGSPGISHVVVDAVAETTCPICGYSDEWDLYVHIRRDQLIGLETATGEHDFAKAGNTFIVLKP